MCRIIIIYIFKSPRNAVTLLNGSILINDIDFYEVSIDTFHYYMHLCIYSNMHVWCCASSSDIKVYKEWTKCNVNSLKFISVGLLWLGMAIYPTYIWERDATGERKEHRPWAGTLDRLPLHFGRWHVISLVLSIADGFTPITCTAIATWLGFPIGCVSGAPWGSSPFAWHRFTWEGLTLLMFRKKSMSAQVSSWVYLFALICHFIWITALSTE